MQHHLPDDPEWENTLFFGETLSEVLGWSYFLAWSLSFWPQVQLNYRRKSVVGLSLDFPVLNLLGFLVYVIYTLVFLTSDTVQAEYRSRHPDSDALVRWNDFAFAAYALLMSTVTVVQCFVLGYRREARQKVSGAAIGVVLGSVVATLVLVLLSTAGKKLHLVEAIDVVYGLSYIKILVSLCKYAPQAMYNYRNQSTEGWAITNIILDFTGGTLSLAQLFLDAYLAQDYSGVAGNPVKLILGILSIAFDIVFIVQHYLLYAINNEDENDSEDDGEDERAGLLLSQ